MINTAIIDTIEQNFALLLKINPKSCIQIDSKDRLYDTTAGWMNRVHFWIFGGNTARAAKEVTRTTYRWISLQRNNTHPENLSRNVLPQLERAIRNLKLYHAHHHVNGWDKYEKERYEDALWELQQEAIIIKEKLGSKQIHPLFQYKFEKKIKRAMVGVECLFEELLVTLEKKQLGTGKLLHRIIDTIDLNQAKALLRPLRKELLEYLNFLNQKKDSLDLECILLKSEIEMDTDDCQLQIRQAKQTREYYRLFELECIHHPKTLVNDRLLQTTQSKLQEIDHQISALEKHIVEKQLALYEMQETLEEIQGYTGELMRLKHVLALLKIR